jgi:hypothetical protein
MNRLRFCAIFVSILMTSPLVATFQFEDLKTKRTLSLVPGTLQDWEIAKAFCLKFFKNIYDQIPANLKEFSTTEDLVNQKFLDHYIRVFVDKKYTFFVLKDAGEFVGYSIFDVIDGVVFSIETQANLVKYSFPSLVEGLAKFIKKELAPNAQYFVAAARKAVPAYGQLFSVCNFREGDRLHPSLANPSEYYSDASRPSSLAEYYQGYQLNLNSI